MMTISDGANTEPNPDAASHEDESLMAGAPMDTVQTSSDKVKPASIVSAGPETNSGDCGDALMRCYNR